jgi:hypothetical protein
MITFMPTGTRAEAEYKWYNEYNAEKVVFDNMTCGDEITLKASGLIFDQKYYVYIQNGTGGPDILLEEQKADIDNNLEIKVNVPYTDFLGVQYHMDLWDNKDMTGYPLSTVYVWINNTYLVKYKHGGNYIDHVILNKPYTNLEISVWNWTGSKYELLDKPVTVTINNPANEFVIDYYIETGGIWDLDQTFAYDYYDGGYHYENNYWVYVDNDLAHHANQPLPVKLNLTVASITPSNPKWGDTITVQGFLRNGTGIVPNCQVRLIAPSGNTYVMAHSASTYPDTGRFTLTAVSDEYNRCAGTWYVGTYDEGRYRIDETDIVNSPHFIKYYSFEVATSDIAVVQLKSPSKVISGFNQSLNISVENKWNDEYYGEMWVHITGLETEWKGVTYNSDEIIVLGNVTDGYSTTGKYAYYVFDDIKFNESGKCTIIVTWDKNNTFYEEMKDLQPNIKGSTTFDVIASADMNIYVDGIPEAVMVEQDGAESCCWKNHSTPFSITIYGNNENKLMNASIYITGCGLDIKIDEKNAIEDGYYKSQGVYNVEISPRTAGTLTIRCVNDTENKSSSRDFKITGLTGSAITSVGADKEITVDTTETIEFTVTHGEFAKVTTCYYYKDWTQDGCLNETITGDGSEGKGLDGIFKITPDIDDISHVGYIVLVGAAGTGNYVYDIIEITPNYDLTIKVIDPTNATNQTLTCGLEHNWKFQVYDKENNIVDEIESVTAEVIDEDGDTIQDYTLEEKTGNIWQMDDFVPYFKGNLLITAVNNTNENEHAGNITLLIKLATIEYSPGGTVAGIGLEDLTINVTGKDANGHALPDATKLYINREEDLPNGIDCDTELVLDKDGKGDFKINSVGNVQQDLNVTLQGHWNSYDGNLTSGTFYVIWPNFDINPDTIYISQSNTIIVTATDYNDEPIEGLNLTFWGSASQYLGGIIPDPVMTDTNGISTFSINPTSSGKLNLTILREIKWVDGVIDWDKTDMLITDKVLTITSLQPLTITVSKSPIYEGETLTVKILSGTSPVSDVSVTIGEETAKTDANGEVTFTIPDPGVDSAIYTITAQKNGYISAEKSITIIKKWQITIVGPASIEAGTSFTITAIAKGQPLSGATITYDSKTVTTDGEGKAKITAPSTKGNYTITATFGDYKPGTFTITVNPAKSPGFELITLIIAIGVALILIKRRRK